MNNRTCTEIGCGRAHRARGLCVTHYNQSRYTEAQRHPRADVSCIVCRTRVNRRTDSKHSPTCSVACRTVVQWGEEHAQADPYVWRHDAIKRAKRYGARIVDEYDRETVFDRDGWQCSECEARCAAPNPYDLRSATVDHVVPLYLGGEHSLANARTCCLSCNASKRGNLAAA